MILRRFAPRFFVGSFVIATCVAASGAGDWPAYRGGSDRSGSTAKNLTPPLHELWIYQPVHAPDPAWPEPLREVHLMPFDRAFHVAISDGMLYFGSSSQHTVTALDLDSGHAKWAFHTDAPVRFAPAVWKGKVYVASDDGHVYCLSAKTGKLVWKHRAGPLDQRIIGNGHIVSRWPLRNGLVVDDGVVYFTAGMWPLEGVYLCALNAEDGSEVWKSERRDGFAPQGYLAAGKTTLVAPTGRANVWKINRADGATAAGPGHGWAIIKDNVVLSGPRPHGANENLPPKSGAFRPRPEYITQWPLAGGGARNIGGMTCAAMSDDTCYAAGNGKLSAFALPSFGGKWSVDAGKVVSLAAAGKTVIAGGKGFVAVHSAADGKKLWSAELDGEADGLAVADGKLIVSTTTGRIICFSRAQVGKPVTQVLKPRPIKCRVGAETLAKQLIKDSGISAGFCLLVGVGDGHLAAALAQQSDLRVYCAEPDAKKVAAARRLLGAAGLYGARVVVHKVERGQLPYPEYFANLVVVASELSDDANGLPAADLRRVLRPCGGTAYRIYRHGGKRASAAVVPGKEMTHSRVSGTIDRTVRGVLPGAGDWTHLYGDAGKSASSGDRRVRWPVRVLWFGEPGPGVMMQRHLRGTAPVSTNGRMFILGQHDIIALDAYNGRQLWTRGLPSVQRRVVDIRGGNLVADADSIYITTGDACLRLDAATGAVRRDYRLPLAPSSYILDQKQTFSLAGRGKVVVQSTKTALELVLTTKDAKVANAVRQTRPTWGDSWELFFDFRPAAKRSVLYGPGAFQLIVVPATDDLARPTSRSGALSAAPAIDVDGKPVPSGSRTTVRISWDRVAKLVGERPADLAFGVILNSSDNGQTRSGRSYKFANNASHRLANFRARFVVDLDRAAKVRRRPALPAALAAKQIDWGHLAVVGDAIVGSVVEQRDTAQTLQHGWEFSSEGHDYTGPRVGEVLGFIGLAPGTRHVFAMDRDTGRLRWAYAAADTVPHNAIAVSGGRVFLIDRVSGAVVDAAKRRGETVLPKTRLVALDLKTGKVAWKVEEELADYQQIRIAHGVLFACSRGGMTAYDAAGGKKLWMARTPQPMHHCSAYVRAPVITSTWVYDEPFAYDLRTGKMRTVATPGGGSAQWRWGGFRGCGTVSGSEHALLFRTSNPMVLDTAGTTGGHSVGGIRPGCFINMITAGGLVLMPEASSGCGCPYNFQTTIVLAPDRYPAPTFRAEQRVFSTRSTCEIVRPTEEGEIRYTLDGSDPTRNSPKYEKPIPVGRTLTVKARIIHEDGGQSPVSSVEFKQVKPILWNGMKLALGLQYHYYVGSWPKLPDFRTLKPAASGVVTGFSLAPRKRDDGFGLQFIGYIKIPKDGSYTFYSASDDGSKLYIGDKMVVNNDGVHPAVERSGAIALKAGMQAIRVEYAEVSGGQALRVLYSGPGIGKKEIPQEALFHLSTN